MPRVSEMLCGTAGSEGIWKVDAEGGFAADGGT